MSVLQPINPANDDGSATLLRVSMLTKHFHISSGGFFGQASVVRAVDDVSFDIFKGETLGVVGESGCGKSTTARLLMQLMLPDQGEIIFDGKKVGRDLSQRDYRRQVQMVFQDSYASLNPRMTLEESIAFGPRVHGTSRAKALVRAHDLLARVGLEPARFAGRYPHELSGGQRQRVNIARALALEPRLVILDEAVSALDKSIEAQVLNLLQELKEEFGLTYVFISHDLNVVRYMADRVLVMYLGKVAEVGESEAIFAKPAHPYTQALLASMPKMDPQQRTTEAPLSGDPPNPIAPPPGCRFHPRCRMAEEICAQKVPELAVTHGGASRAACLMVANGSGHSAQRSLEAAP